MLDVQILAAAISSRAAYERVKPFLRDTDFTPPVAFWWQELGQWYKDDPHAQSAERELLGQRAETKLANVKHRDTLLGVIRDLPEPASAENTAQITLELRRHNVGLELASAIAAGNQRSVGTLYKQYGLLLEATTLGSREDVEYAVEYDRLHEKVGTGRRIAVSPARLNDRIGGGALPGHHILIFGRPEIGKSTFSINMAVGFAVRGERVLYGGTEDNINVLKSRAMGRAAGMSHAEVEQQPEEAAKRAVRRLEDRLTFVHLKSHGIPKIKELIEKHEPSILFLDQLRNLPGRGEGLTQKLEENGIAVRQLLATYGLVGVSVSQANDRTQGYTQQPPKWLGLADIDSSRTGLPGTVDLALGLGGDANMMQHNQRTLSLPKNKLSDRPQDKEGIVLEFDVARCKVS